MTNVNELDFYDAEALLDRLSTGLQGQKRQVVFVVGSGLTVPATPDGAGVPGVQGVINLIRSEFSGVQLDQLDKVLENSDNRYQEAFKFLLGRRGPASANGIIKQAVGRARRQVLEGNETSYSISASTGDDICRSFDIDSAGWLLTPAADGLGRLVSVEDGPFSRMVVTTNFDPLIGAAIAQHGGHSFRTFLHRDGSLGQADGSGTHIIHLHGYWYGSDTLHTPRQLVQPRPQLKASLSQLLRGNIFVVMAYSGWDDVFTRTLMDVLLEDSSFPEIIWCFYEEKPELRRELVDILSPGLDRGRVMLYSGINVHNFLPKLSNIWNKPAEGIPLGNEIVSEEIKEEIVTASYSSYSSKISRVVSSLQKIDQDRPPLVEYLVGREQELEDLCTASFRVGFITGFGGQGKSALAAAYFKSESAVARFSLRIWRDCREQSARFEDQIVSIIEALNINGVSSAELAQQQINDLADLFVQLTAEMPMLLVFDNVDHYVDIELRTMVSSVGRFIDRLLQLDSRSQVILTCRPVIELINPAALSKHLEGLTIEAAKQLFELRGTKSNHASVERAHAATKGHSFWLDLLAAQVSRRSPAVTLDDLLFSISAGTGELPDTTLRSIWQTLRPREQITLQALAEVLRPTSHLELADYVRQSLSYKNLTKAVKYLRDLNLIVVKARENEVETYELHPLVRAFIQRTVPRVERKPYIFAILQSYAAWLGSHKTQLSKKPESGVIHRWIEASELCLNVDRIEEALQHLDDVRSAVKRSEPPNEFVRVAKRLFHSDNISKLKFHSSFERLYDTYVRLLSHLGQTEEVTEALEIYRSNLDGKDTRYIHYCDMQCYIHWMIGEHSVAIRWGIEGEDLRASGVDTLYSAAHNLALAQRDAGAIEPALKQFLQGVALEDVIDPGKVDRDLSGSLYGNVGRCLQLMGQIDPAISCFRKSARLIEDDSEDIEYENQAYIRQWIGELYLASGNQKFSRMFLEAAVGKWLVISPPRAEKLVLKIHENFGYFDVAPQDAEIQVLAWIMKIHLPSS